MSVEEVLAIIKSFFDAIVAILKEIGFIKEDAAAPAPEAPKAEG